MLKGYNADRLRSNDGVAEEGVSSDTRTKKEFISSRESAIGGGSGRRREEDTRGNVHKDVRNVVLSAVGGAVSNQWNPRAVVQWMDRSRTTSKRR